MSALCVCGQPVADCPHLGDFRSVEAKRAWFLDCAGAMVVMVVAFLGLASQGCMASFEEAKLAGRGYSASSTAAPAPSARCRELDDARGQWSAIAKAAGVVSGAGGIASIPVNPEARPYVVGGVVVFLTAGAYALIRSESASAAWVRECSQ